MKPQFPIGGPYPRLSEDLPLNDPRECAQCGSGQELSVWQECDTADVPESIYIVLCERCADRLIDPHPRLYHRLAPNQPAPGVMPICLGCAHRAGNLCWSRQSLLRGGRGVRLDHPRPMVAFVDGTGKGGRRMGGTMTMYPGIVFNCSGKELLAA